MPITNPLDYSETNASNTEIGNIGILGTNPPRNLDNAQREQMVHLKKFFITSRDEKSGAYSAVKDDLNQRLDFTTDATLTTAAAATLTDGWRCEVFASGGNVTINPNGSETVNGEDFIILPEGRSGILSVRDGNFSFQYFSTEERTRFKIVMSGNQSAGTLAKMNLDTVSYDVGENWNSDDETVDPDEGEYYFTITVSHGFSDISDGSLSVYLYKNGSSLARDVIDLQVSNGSGNAVSSWALPVTVGSGDAYEVYISATGGTTISAGEYATTFSGFKI